MIKTFIYELPFFVSTIATLLLGVFISSLLTLKIYRLLESEREKRKEKNECKSILRALYSEFWINRYTSTVAKNWEKIYILMEDEIWNQAKKSKYIHLLSTEIKNKMVEAQFHIILYNRLVKEYDISRHNFLLYPGRNEINKEICTKASERVKKHIELTKPILDDIVSKLSNFLEKLNVIPETELIELTKLLKSKVEIKFKEEKNKNIK